MPRAFRDSPFEVPLSECSTDEAIHFLSVLYSVNGSKSRGAPHLSTARLAHKYGMQVNFHRQGVSLSIFFQSSDNASGTVSPEPERAFDSPRIAGCCGLMR
jgi:hypothetical protein